MIDLIPGDWREALATTTSSARFAALTAFVETERMRNDTAVYPPAADVFAALSLTPLSTVKAVILGQDPYHGEGEAHGLAFSCLRSPRPPSLTNILKEWRADLGVTELPAAGSLERWARNGVLLLNAVLTVRRDEPDSHHGHGWEEFTDAVVSAVTAKPYSVAFLLWGQKAQKKAGLIEETHFAVRASHPSPLSKGGFLGTRPFSNANAGLAARGRPPIDWTL